MVQAPAAPGHCAAAIPRFGARPRYDVVASRHKQVGNPHDACVPQLPDVARDRLRSDVGLFGKLYGCDAFTGRELSDEPFLPLVYWDVYGDIRSDIACRRTRGARGAI